MPERTSYAPGTPSWVDVTAPDVAAARAFYEGLFGWEGQDMGPEAGGYVMWSKGGKAVAACSPLSPEMAAAGVPAHWTTYITVADADAAAATATEAGGAVMAPPFDVMEAGRMAVLQDPTGGVFAVWQPNGMPGAEIVNEPGSLCWNELNVRDVDTAIAFYTKLFPWTVTQQPMAEGMPPYREIAVDRRMVAGCLQMTDDWPEGIPTNWLPYFAVADCDAALARVEELGGGIIVPAMDVPVGRFGACRDPHGAVFAVIALKGPVE